MNGYPSFYPRIALVGPSPGDYHKTPSMINQNSSANGLVVWGNKPLPQLKLAQFCAALCSHGELNWNRIKLSLPIMAMLIRQSWNLPCLGVIIIKELMDKWNLQLEMAFWRDCLLLEFWVHCCHIEADTKWMLYCRCHFQVHFLNEDYCILIPTALKWLVTELEMMAWHETGDKPSSDRTRFYFVDAYTSHLASMS